MTATTATFGTEFVVLSELDLTVKVRPIDPDHVRVLAGVIDQCPAILVHRSMFLLDGHQRVAAAITLGREKLPVVWIDGDQASMLEAAVTGNAAHGLPLTHAQRLQAAQRLFEEAPHWSTRRVAKACGLPESTLRPHRPSARAAHLDTRTGIDGRRRHHGDAARRDHAQRLVEEGGMSDRAIARAADLSPTTVGVLRRQHANSAPPQRPHVRQPASPVRRLLQAVRRLVDLILRPRRRSWPKWREE